MAKSNNGPAAKSATTPSVVDAVAVDKGTTPAPTPETVEPPVVITDNSASTPADAPPVNGGAGLEMKGEISDALGKVDTELHALEGDAISGIDNVGVDFHADFGLLPRLAAELRAAQVAGKVDAEKALSELHESISLLGKKIQAAFGHVGDDLEDFLDSLKSHL